MRYMSVQILNGEDEVENGGDAEWTEGENTLTIKVKSGSETATYTVTVTYTEPEASKLTGLTIGSLTLTPTFDADVTEYAVTTSNASNKITATADVGVSIAITVNGDALENEQSATWETGENIVTVVASAEGTTATTYTVTVTKE